MCKIWDGLRYLFETTFETKAGFLNPVEWRPREYNSPPDVVCNWVLAKRADIVKLETSDAIEAVARGGALQLFCDGGFVAGIGALSFVVHVYGKGPGPCRQIGYIGKFIPQARSAFQAEITALQLAIEWMSAIVPLVLQQMHGARVKRVRFQL